MSMPWVREFVVALAMLGLTACGKAPAPSDDEVKAFLAGQAPQLFELSLDKVEPFIDGDTAQGRVSVSAALVATEDLYVMLEKGEVTSAYAALGVPSDHLEFIRTLQPDPVFLRRTLTKGSRFPFVLDVQARKDVDRWSFMSNQGVEQAARLTVTGSPRSAFPQDAAILDDTSSPRVKQVLALSKEIAAADGKVMTSFEKVIASRNPVNLRFWQVERPGHWVRNDKPFSMTFTAATPITQVPALGIKPAHFLISGPVVFRGTPSDTSGSYNRATGEFKPWKEIQLSGTLTRYGKPGAIKSAIALRLYYLRDQSMAQFHPWNGSDAYFEDGKIQSFNESSIDDWRWAE